MGEATQFCVCHLPEMESSRGTAPGGKGTNPKYHMSLGHAGPPHASIDGKCLFSVSPSASLPALRPGFAMLNPN